MVGVVCGVCCVGAEVVLRDMQTSTKKEGVGAVTRRIYREQGILGFYKGWWVYLLYGFRSGIQVTSDPAAARHVVCLC